jgi:transcription initiation factor TFIIIB Brf1 subunit/transcription initiation factor TFIIB
VALGFSIEQRVTTGVSTINPKEQQTMNTPREFQALHAEHRAREALAQARSTLERALRELDRYTSRFEEAESLRDKADVMNWTLNELACNITPNLRLDLIASAQAELVRADTMAE